jgi:NAD(P)-dependent dehydrogenase (short-subunit alcohol dehydrogenase family)
LQVYGDVNYLELDVTDNAAIPVTFRSAVAHFGPISILVNNAGQAESALLMRTDLDLFNRMLAVNLTSIFMCTQMVLPGMLTAGWGRIVNIASTAGLTGYAYTTAYCAAKHGVVGLTRALALEVARKGVTVNAICPGYTETELVQKAIATVVKKTGRTTKQTRAEFAKNNPQGRLIQVEEVAHAVAWMCMPGASAINGQAILVDGGELIKASS